MGDGFGEEVEEGGGQEDADGERDEVGELAFEGMLAGAEERGGGGGGGLDAGDGQDGG